MPKPAYQRAPPDYRSAKISPPADGYSPSLALNGAPLPPFNSSAAGGGFLLAYSLTRSPSLLTSALSGLAAGALIPQMIPSVSVQRLGSDLLLGGAGALAARLLGYHGSTVLLAGGAAGVLYDVMQPASSST